MVILVEHLADRTWRDRAPAWEEFRIIADGCHSERIAGASVYIIICCFQDISQIKAGTNEEKGRHRSMYHIVLDEDIVMVTMIIRMTLGLSSFIPVFDVPVTSVRN